MMHKKTNARWRMMATTLASLTFLAALIVYQSTAAQEQAAPIPPLNPPFKFEADQAAFTAAGFPVVPPSATRLLTETFGDSYQQTASITGTTPAWRYYVDPGSGSSMYWNRVISQVTDIYTDTAWASCGLCNGGVVGSLNPDTDDYPPGQGAWLVYGPITLTNYYAAEVTFNYTMSVKSGDAFRFGISNDGTTFAGSQVPFAGDFTSSSWLTHTFNLGGYAGKGKPGVYLGFYFQSNGDANVGKGVFIDNVSLRAAPYKLTYMPVVAKNFAIATPTPQFRYNYTWDSGLAGDDPDFIAWGRSYSSGSPVVYEQGSTLGRAGDGMYVYNTQTGLVTMAGPDATAPTNLEISADFFVNTGKDNARYGIIFGADSTTFRRNTAGEPRFDANTNYFKYALIFPPGSGNDIAADYKFERCAGDGANCIEIVARTALPGGLGLGRYVWHTATVRRQGSTITLLVNGTVIRTLTDTNLGGDREFGMFIQSASANNPTVPLEVFFDNYRVTQLP